MRVNTVPVSTSVTLILYSLIIPLMSVDGGGDQEREIALEFKVVPVRFCGEALGAEDIRNEKKALVSRTRHFLLTHQLHQFVLCLYY